MQVSIKSKIAWSGLALSICGSFALWFAGLQGKVFAAESGERRPVLVELFTSEGCSSCPPADALLASLDETQSVAGARVIVLSEHVTYWDRLGWRDPFSLDAMTRRQQQYGQRFGLDDVYTPQAVIDGAAQLVGSDQRGLRRDIAQAAEASKIDLKIESVQVSRATIQFKVRVAGGGTGQSTDLVAALAEDAVQSSVARGENAGRTLRHVAVVRTMQSLGSGAEDGRSLALRLPDVIAKGEPKTHHSVRLVVFLADKKTGRVLGVDEQAIQTE